MKWLLSLVDVDHQGSKVRQYRVIVGSITRYVANYSEEVRSLGELKDGDIGG